MANEYMPDELFRLARAIDCLHPNEANDAADLAFAIDALIVHRINEALKRPPTKPEGDQK